MCTYEHLVEVTLAHGRIPLVVPQLRTITLGGAVSGLGHRVDQLPQRAAARVGARDGRAHRRRRGRHDQAGRRALRRLPQLLRLARLRDPAADRARAGAGVRRPPARPRSTTPTRWPRPSTRIVAEGEWAGERVDGLDGVAFAPDELYLTLARWTDEPGPTSDYAGQQVFYRSIQQRADRPADDRTTTSGAGTPTGSGARGPSAPSTRSYDGVWPRRLRRSDVYWKLVALDRRFGIGDRLDRRAGRPQGERVVQDVEVPVDRLPEFLAWFDREVGMRPVWLCPLRLRRGASGRRPAVARLPADRRRPPTSTWGSGASSTSAPTRRTSPRNRAIEAKVSELGGHKCLYSEAFYEREEFDRLYGGAHLARVKAIHDPDDRLTALYDKVVQRR